MKFLQRLIYFTSLLVLFAFAFGFPLNAQQSISTQPNHGFIGPIGAPPTDYSIGQSITVPAQYTELQSFYFAGAQEFYSTGPMAYRIYIYAFNNSTLTESGPALYTSNVFTFTTGTTVPEISPNLALTAGNTYVVLATVDGVPQTPPNSTTGNNGYIVGSTTPYAGGSLVYTNNDLLDGYTPAAFSSNGETSFLATFITPTLYSTANLTPNQQSVVNSINDGLIAGNTTASFLALNAALSGLPAYALPAALDQLSPVKFGNFTGQTAFNNASFTTQQMDEYLDSQRNGPGGIFIGGNGSIDATGLSINDPSYDPALAMVHSRLLAWNPGPANGLVSDSATPMFGGTDMKDVKNMTAASSEVTNPWNVYVQGNVILAQGFSQADIPHFNDNTESVTIGADYRFTPHFLLGATLGYGHTDASLDNFGSTATVDGYSPGLYASYADHGWYANATGNYTYNSYTQSREIAFLGETARSATAGNEGVADLDGGYDFHIGALTYGPLAGVQYTRLSVQGYNESGSVADLSVNDQDSDSLRSRLGGRIAYSMTRCGVTFTPHLDASWQHEFLDQSRSITTQFTGSGLGSFNVRTANPSRDSALVDAGLNADLNRTVSIFGDYEVQAGQDDYFGQSVQAGVKIGF